MIIYYIFALFILIVQVVVMVEAYRHLVYTNRTWRPKPSSYQPRVALISPCKGLDTTFDRNIESFFQLDYPDYEIFFVVESTDDPAHQRLQEIIEKNGRHPSAPRPHLVVAGPAESSSQKLHNLVTVCDSLPEDFEVLAFVDSDICLKSHFLTSLVHPLRRRYVGASTGYRWFVPTDRRLSTLILSAMNAFFASTLGPHRWNSTWGGAMALQRQVYDRIDLSQVWRRAFTDDYSLTNAVKKAGLQVAFAPACFVASHEKISWPDLISFARRQFVITRVYVPHLWLLAVFGLGLFVLGFWGGTIVYLILYLKGSPEAPIAALLPAILLICAFLKALARQIMIRKILPEQRRELFLPALIDIFCQPILAPFSLACILSTSFTRVLVWRGIRYILYDVDHTEILTPASES